MKIKINERESYMIDLPNEVSLMELSEILTRLNHIQKIGMKENPFISPVSQVQKVFREKRPYTFNPEYTTKGIHKLDRETVIKLLKVYYSNMTIPEQEIYFKENTQFGRKGFSSVARKLMKEKKITPQDLGFETLPTMWELTRSRSDR